MEQACAMVSVINFCARRGDSKGNLARMEAYTKEAADKGSRLVLFPELALTGSGAADGTPADWAEPMDGPACKAMAAKTRETGIYAVFGMPVRDGKHIYNSVVACGPDGLIGRYDKLHLSPGEVRWIRPGQRLPMLFDTPFGRVGTLCGEDCFFYFEGLRYLKAKGAALILNAAACCEPQMRGAYQKILTRRVGLNTIHLATANRADPGFTGGSHILSPAEPIEQAHVAAGCPLDGDEAGTPGIFSAVLDMTAGRTMPHYPYFEFNPRVGSPDWRPDIYKAMYEEALAAQMWQGE